MKIATTEITVRNEILALTNQRAVFWQRESALILSDLHIGKTAHFRRHGIPIPDSILQKDLLRLGQLITYFKPTQLLIVGDLFHAESNTDLNTFENWINQFNTLRMVLIKGNHDRISTAVAERFKLSIMSPSLFIPPLNFVHDYEETLFNHFCISGHTHPGVLMEGKGRQRIKLPCYQLTDNQLILPAFSLFTGLNTRQAPKDCEVFAFTDTAIFKV